MMLNIGCVISCASYLFHFHAYILWLYSENQDEISFTISVCHRYCYDMAACYSYIYRHIYVYLYIQMREHDSWFSSPSSAPYSLTIHVARQSGGINLDVI